MGYLLARKQKMFPAAVDGGYAAPLLARGIVILAAQPGQLFSSNAAPMAIPDHIWDVLVQHESEFPYTSPKEDRSAAMAHTLDGCLRRWRTPPLPYFLSPSSSG